MPVLCPRGGNSMLSAKRLCPLTLVLAALLPPLAIGSNARDELARDVDRAESMRTVKNLQRTYAQYSHFGLWNEMAGLFASDATFIFDDQTIKGRAAIAAFLTEHEGAGHQGLAT